MKVSIVIPTAGRPSLNRVLDALRAAPRDWEVLVVRDEARRGPAAARNVGWRAARHEWVAFLDDDVIPDPVWLTDLRHDLRAVPPDVGGVQGRVRVPLPQDRRPTDWERNTAGLADAAWITADMAYRRAALEQAGGFDERFPRAYREDAELAYRVKQAGWRLTRGTRRVTHPVRAERRFVSLRTQRGNADDARLRRLYGPRWRELLEIAPGRRAAHTAVTLSALAALGGVIAGRPRLATLGAVGWAAGTAQFAAKRIAPGPRTREEVVEMLLTSALIPPLAVGHWLAEWLMFTSPRLGKGQP
jgi:hypothetical protein